MSAADSSRGGSSAPGHAEPDDPQALVDEINRTRAELGDTVEALAARVDVKARAQQRAAEVSAQAKGRLQELAGRAGELASGVTGKAGQARETALSSSKTVLGTSQPAASQLTGRAAQAGTAAWNAAPVPVRQGARRVARTAGQHRVPVAVAAGAGAVLVAGWLVLRRRHR